MSNGDVSEARDIVVSNRFPSFVKKVRPVHRAVRARHKSKSDVCDEIVDEIRSQISLSVQQMWADENERNSALAHVNEKFSDQSSDEYDREIWRKFIDEALEYDGKVGDWPIEQLATEAFKIRAASREKTRKLSASQSAENDAVAFFNAPEAFACFEYWAKLPVWTFEETIALSFGRDPAIVNEDSLRRPRYAFSHFVRDFRERSFIVRRAIVANDIAEPIRPKAFVEWAINVGIEVPDGLVTLVTDERDARWWQDQYDREVEKRQEIEKILDSINNNLNNEDNINFEHYESRRKSSFYKMILAMAVSKYKFNPVAKRQPASQLIAADIENVGFDLKEAAILSILREAVGALEYQSPEQMKPKSRISGRPNA